MASWRVELVADGSGEKAILDLHDTFGPYNSWERPTQGAFIPDSGIFTNQTGRAVENGDLGWILERFDLDVVSINSTGPGEARDNLGFFPSGPFTWRVNSSL